LKGLRPRHQIGRLITSLCLVLRRIQCIHVCSGMTKTIEHSPSARLEVTSSRLTCLKRSKSAGRKSEPHRKLPIPAIQTQQLLQSYKEDVGHIRNLEYTKSSIRSSG
jgi:hypothetical protein